MSTIVIKYQTDYEMEQVDVWVIYRQRLKQWGCCIHHEINYK